MITIKSYGNIHKIEGFLTNVSKANYRAVLESYGKQGVAALSSATPYDTGLAASSWAYEIQQSSGSMKLIWTNSDLEGGVPVVILVQYGHATRNGSYVEGRDFINPAIQPIFDKIASDLWKEVNRT